MSRIVKKMGGRECQVSHSIQTVTQMPDLVPGTNKCLVLTLGAATAATCRLPANCSGVILRTALTDCIVNIEAAAASAAATSSGTAVDETDFSAGNLIPADVDHVRLCAEQQQTLYLESATGGTITINTF